MLRYWALGFVVIAILATPFLDSASDVGSNSSEVRPEKSKIGVYDNRAIAIAWAASAHNPVGEKMKEYEAAKKANDKQKIAELEAWGPLHQKQLHFQGFGRVPVDELLVSVHENVKNYLVEKNLVAIAMYCDQISDQTEVIDITDDLVKMFNPSERTLKSIEQVRKQQPVSLVELSKMGEHE